MKSRFRIFFQILFLTLCSCSKFQKGNNGLGDMGGSVKAELKKSRKVVIIGKSDDVEALDFLNIIDGSYYFGKNEGDKIEKYKDSVVLLLNDIRDFQVSEFTANSKTNLYKTKLFLSSGDTIKFEISKGKLKFFGPNSALNNFYFELSNNTPSYIHNPYNYDVFQYKKNVVSIYSQKNDFLEKYVEMNNISSVDAINFIKDDLRQEFMYELMNPRSKFVELDDINITMYYPEIDNIKNLVAKEYSEEQRVFSSNMYFDGISIEDINRPDLIHNTVFRENLNLYVRNLFDTSEYADYTREKFLAEKEFVEKNIHQDLKNVAITGMIVDYYVKGFGHDTENAKFMIATIDSCMKNVDGYTKEYLEEIRTNLKEFKGMLPNAVLESKMVNRLGDTVTLKEIFGRSDKRIKVIDFWASWCPPCVNQIQESKEFKDRLMVENNVEWLYISIDEDKEKWLSKSNALQHSLNFRNSYYLIDGKDSSLGRFFKVNWVPRYIILNKENKIVLSNAPIPSPNGSFEGIIDDIKMTENK